MLLKAEILVPVLPFPSSEEPDTNFEKKSKDLPKNDFIIFPHWNSLSSSLKSLANKATKSTARTKQFILQLEPSCHFELTSIRLNQIKL